jgi:hypothetical protein
LCLENDERSAAVEIEDFQHRSNELNKQGVSDSAGFVLRALP